MDYNIQEILAKRKANIDKLQNYLDAGKTLDEKIVKKTLQNIKRGEQQLIDNGYTDFIAINNDGTFNSSEQQSNQNTILESPEENNTYTDNNNNLEDNISISQDDEPLPSSKIEIENEEVIKSNIVTENNTIVSSNTDNNFIEANSDTSNTELAYPSDSTPTTESQDKSTSVNKTKKKLDRIKKNKTEKLGVSIKKSNINNISKLARESGRTPNNVVNYMLETIYDEKTEGFNIEFAKKEENKNTSYLIDERYAKAIEVISKRTNISKSDIFNVLLEEALKDYI